jgi:formate dehydrogenase iron-sulfur subunit
MALPLQERGMESDSAELVRMTLIEGGASRALVDSLIPTRPLEDGEQYRFHFDMTKCIGCRSCEVACNEQNGNPADIKWRRVGELEGGVYPLVSRTYLSMGCNHCVDADCLRGCPVDAYSKDPITGIVMHSADACIGCQYCVWNCPYSVPQFNPERGVVGKCDMCRDRLLDGREPACVNACPENAIEIEIVNKIEWTKDYTLAESPGMPPAGQTISTTRITLPKGDTAGLVRVDTNQIPLEHAHGSLVLMTTAMQAAFGLLCFLLLDDDLTPSSLAFLLLVTMVAINISVFHLGRPAYAWRALKMWRRSWLSREVLCFTLFLCALSACAAACWAPLVHLQLQRAVLPLALAAVVFGFMGTAASACIYLVKARPAWDLAHTPFDFLLSAGMLGATLNAALAGPARWMESRWHSSLLTGNTPSFHPHPWWLALVAGLWLLNQILRTVRLRRSQVFELRATFQHLRGTRLRWKVVLAWSCATGATLLLALQLPLLSLVAASIAVLVSRYLFFVSVVPRSMALTFLGSSGSQERNAA